MTDKWFEINHKNVLDLCPDDVDPEEWAEFRYRFHQGENLIDIGYPIQIDVELNSGCNMTCPFCIHGYSKIKNREMCLEKYQEIIRQAVELGVKSVKLNYINEPLLRKDLEDIIRWTRDQGIINIYFVTNGTALTKKRRTKLINSGLTKLFVSIDAVTSETYNKQRLSGQFNRIVTNVKSFIRERNDAGKRHPLVLVSFLRNTLNEHEEQAFKNKWGDLADVISIQRMNEVPDRKTGLTLHYDKQIEGCKFPFKQLVVETDGTIIPCCKLYGKKMPLGKFGEEHPKYGMIDLKEAWRQTSSLRFIHSENMWDKHPVCSKCMRCE
jgi:radical SAM protein with 4Fe4S-binding SPASM domain